LAQSKLIEINTRNEEIMTRGCQFIVLMTRMCILISVLAFSGVLKAGQPLLQIFTEKPQQGSLIVGRMLVDGDVYLEDKKLALTETGEFVFGVGRDSALKIELEVKQATGSAVFPISIAKREWRIERVDGLPPNKVNPTSPETLARIKQEGAQVTKARQGTSFQTAFMMQFIKPAEGRISGVYGSQRVLNGEPKRPHFGLDIANKTGTPVIAPADGVVTLAENDLFYSGGSVIIDHGYGVSTTYIHLDSIAVKVGQELKQGDLIGGIGATGRATGAHLDWRLNWYNTRLDPQLLLKP
jgi:murein DD-endopeptidase MepM/ murein hydrolase activator NlpD